MANALFLDAGWVSPFSEGTMRFTNLDGETNDVAAFGGHRVLPILQTDTLTALEIPYEDEELALLIIMPENLSDYEATLNTESLTDIINNLVLTDSSLFVPSWSNSSEVNLAVELGPIGFPTQPWDFSRMINGQQSELMINSSQVAKIEVDKNGTKAGAASSVSSAPVSVPDDLKINRPFFYAIRDRITGLVLFTGRVVNP